MMASADGPIKTFPLRGIKESSPYMHDGRLLTLEDTVEFFNLIPEAELTAQEKADIVAFLRVAFLRVLLGCCCQENRPWIGRHVRGQSVAFASSALPTNTKP